MATLDQEIATAIQNENAKASVFSELIRRTDRALELGIKAREAEEIRLVDPTNEDHQHTQKTLEKIKLSNKRMKAALPILKEKYAAAKDLEEFDAIKPKYNAVVEKHNELSDAIGELYKDFVEQVVSLFKEAIEVNQSIRQMNVQTKGFDVYPIIPLVAERLLVELKLPSQDGFYWPDVRETHMFAVQASSMVSAAMANKSQAYSADWHSAREHDNELKKVEWGKRNELQRQQAELAKKEYIEDQRKAARGE